MEAWGWRWRRTPLRFPAPAALHETVAAAGRRAAASYLARDKQMRRAVQAILAAAAPGL